MMNCFLGSCQLFDRSLVIKLWEKPFNIFFVVMYAQTAQSMAEEIQKFYCTMDNTKAQCKLREIKNERPECKIIGGARLVNLNWEPIMNVEKQGKQPG